MMQSLTLERRRAWRIPAALLTTGLMIVIPMLVHLVPVPGGPPAGARLLPIFYAPLVAVVLFDVWVGVAASLAGPAINHWITGMPAQPMVVLLTAELLCFSIIVALLQRRSSQFWWIAPVAYVLGKGVAWLLVGLLPMGPPGLTPAAFWASLVVALPGLGLLALLGLIVQRLESKAA
jgi:hypothetical protein